MKFEPGNKFGNRWQPGQSGNPAGRPPKDPMTSALKARFEAEPDLLERLVETGIRKAIEGDFRYWKEIFDRLDGKVREAEPDEPEYIDWSELDNEGDTVRPISRYAIDYASQPVRGDSCNAGMKQDRGYKNENVTSIAFGNRASNRST